MTLGDAQIFVDAHDQMADDRIDHPQAPVDLLHQLTGPANGLDDVRALAVVADLVGQLAPTPVLGLFDGAVEALDDLLDLRVQLGDAGSLASGETM